MRQDRRSLQAKAEADALKLQKQEITSDLLELRRIEAQLKAIEKWSGRSFLTYNEVDAVPFIRNAKRIRKLLRYFLTAVRNDHTWKKSK